MATECPRCGAAITGYPDDWKCGTTIYGGFVDASDQCKLNQLAALFRQHCNPSVNVGAHALAAKGLAIIEERTNA
jgi:hypothetical protein